MTKMINMKSDKIYVYIDESGTLPDPKDRVIVVAAVGTTSPSQVEDIYKGKIELKFYTAGEKTKLAVLIKIAQKNFAIFVLIVDKKGRKVPDSPENFATISWLLMEDVLDFYTDVTEIIFDKHFTSEKKIEEFNTTLIGQLKRQVKIEHVDSRFNKGVNIADMIAGAVLANETNKGSKFYDLIVNEVISVKKLNWPEAKRRFFDKKKTCRTGVNTHPSKL